MNYLPLIEIAFFIELIQCIYSSVNSASDFFNDVMMMCCFMKICWISLVDVFLNFSLSMILKVDSLGSDRYNSFLSAEDSDAWS